jgi:DNA-binding LytR/AlgR family response regulator
MNCLIVDDEPIARDILKNYCSFFPEINVVGFCSNVLEAKSILNTEKVDIMFLDINMPVIDGLSFIKTLKSKPRIVLTTAYKEYAAEAFDLDVADYLVKPFSLDRFMVALDKVRETQFTKPPQNTDEESHLFIRAEGKIYKVVLNEILYGEAHGNYTLIVTQDITLKSPMTFTAFENLIPSEDFDRIHRSFIINRSKITYIDGNRIFLGSHEVPLGQNYREGFLKKLGL